MKNEHDALDVIQEVAYQSFKKINTLKEPNYFKTWLIKISINCSINLMKKKQKVVQLEQKHEELMAIELDDLPLSMTLQDLISRLNDDEKSAVILRYYHNYTFKEISELLNIPVGTSKSILYRALDKLRIEYVKGDDFNEQ